MKKITLEQAQELLETLDPSMPKDFTVMSVAYSKTTESYFVEWFDEIQKEIHDDGVSQMTADGAKFAYSFEPKYSYSAIWFNENEKGEFDATCQQLNNDEIQKIKSTNEKLVLLDCV